MTKQYLKKIRDSLPESLKHLFGKVFRNTLIKNKVFLEHFDFLNKTETFSEREVEDFQLQTLKQLLTHAYQYVPYYTETFDRIGFIPRDMTSLHDVKKLPFLTKEIIRENYDKLQSTKPIENGFYESSTGGTTGEPLKLILDYNSFFKENAFVFFLRRRLKYNFKDKLATFRGIEFQGKFWKYNPTNNELLLSPFKLSKNNLSKYISRIEKFKPQYLNGYLSSLYLFAKLLEEQNVKLKVDLKGIFLIGENIDQSQRTFLENFFNVSSYAFYGHTERCVIADEVQKGLYKINPFYGYTELISKGENEFEIVSTGFLNETMPLIRYKTNDKCTLEGGYLSIKGRWNVTDNLIGNDDELISHISFNFHSDVLKNVADYQFFQQEKGKAELLIIPNSAFQPSEIQAIKKEIDKKTKGVIEFDIKQVENLMLTSGGKFKRFISLVNRS